MAEIIDSNGKMHDLATNSKANAALTTGIIGTALGVLGGGVATALGARGMGCRNHYNGDAVPENLYVERKENQDYVELTKEYYQGRLLNQRELADAFFDAYKRDVDNSFALYKNQRDEFDIMGKDLVKASFDLYKNQRDGFDILNQKITDASFGLYKNQRDEKDALIEKINNVDKKVDMMAAIRPYQDALINAKIDNTAMVADFNLAKRTCRMIQGEIVLPNDPTVTGYPSQLGCNNS